MNLRTKVLLPFVLTGLALLLFLYGYWMPRHLSELKQQYREATERHLVSVVEGLVPLLLAHQLDAVYENLDTLRTRNSNWLRIQLLGPNGELIYPLLPPPAPVAVADIHPMAQPIRYQEVELGRLVVDVDFDAPLKATQQRQHQLFAIACSMILLAIAAIWLVIERTVSRPITDLARASKRLADGDFSLPLPPAGRDEVGVLIQNFTQMRSAINIYQEELVRRNESLSQLSQAIAQSPISIVIANCGGDIEFVNPRLTEVLGFRPEELLGKEIAMLKADDSDGASPFAAIWQTVVAGHKWHGEFQSRRKDGELIWHAASLAPVVNNQGEVRHVVALLEDVSKRRELEEQLRQAQKMEAVGQLTGGIAHDFNNILSAIIGYGELTTMRMAASDPLRGNIEEILRASQRAAALIRSLMAFSRKQIASPTYLDVNDSIVRIEKLLRRLLREDIDFSILAHDTPLTVFIDPGQLEQILINLVTNARDAMPGGGQLTIETAAGRMDGLPQEDGAPASGPAVVITVKDSGSGMDKATMDRIFEPFFTTKEVGRGTGLGLSMVYGIVKQNSGYITCASEPGQGTTFTVYLPLIAASATVAEAGVSDEVRGGSERILLAEDDDIVRRFTKTILERAGYAVVDAANGAAAVGLFLEHPEAIDLLLLDVIMPKMNGPEAFDKIRLVRPGIRVLFASGYTADLVEQQGVLRGEINFIAKPFTPTSLLKKVRAVLDGQGRL